MANNSYVDNNAAFGNTSEPIGMVISKPPQKTAYKSGEIFNPTGMVIELVYPSGYRSVLTGYEYRKTPLTGEDTFVEICYKSFIVRQRITVDARVDTNSNSGVSIDRTHTHSYGYACEYPECDINITSIDIYSMPTKTLYYEGEYFDPSGMVVMGSIAEGRPMNITAYSITSLGPLVVGSNVIEIRFKDLTTELIVTGIPKVCAKAIPATQDINLVDGVDGKLYLGTGNFTATFADINAGDGNLPLKISHVFSNSGNDFNCGTGWRLNLNCTLKKRATDRAIGEYLTNVDISNLDEVDYIYTDSSGVRYTFDEVFYYLNDNGNKVAFPKQYVRIDLDGKLYFSTGKEKYYIVRELKTASGLRLSTKLESVKGIEKIEQRAEEIAKLENEIQQYKDAIAELEYNIYQNECFDKIAPGPDKSITNQVSLNDAKSAANEFNSVQEKIGLRIQDVQQRLNVLSVHKNLWDGEDHLTWLLQKYNLQLAQVYNDDTQDSQNERRDAITAQYKRNLAEYTKILVQKENQLKQYKLQTPVAYLIGDDTILCFNEYGNLCGIVDNYDNQIVIIWDDIKTVSGEVSVIKSVYCGAHTTTLEYDRKGLLLSITDYNGNRVKYTYNTDGQLLSATYSNGNVLRISYNSNHLIASISNAYTMECAAISYSERKLYSVQLSNSIQTLTDGPGSSLVSGIVNFETKVRYADSRTTIETADETNVYYLDYYGGLAASYGKRSDGTISNAPSFTYLNNDKTFGYSVSESGPAIWTKTDLINTSDKPFHTISKAGLPKGITEFVLGAEGNITVDDKLSDTGMPFILPFKKVDSSKKTKYEIRAVVKYASSSETFRASFDYKNNRSQYAALPIRLNKNKMSELIEIELYFECSLAAFADNIRFAPAEWEYCEIDEFGAVKKKATSEKLIGFEGGVGVYQSTSTEYTNDENHRPLKERTTITTSGAVKSTKYAVTKNSYCEHGNLVKTESYIEGEEGTSGINVTERVCDEKGHVIKEFTYNSLDSSTKFYKESEVQENGLKIAETDETGENKIALEYIDGTTTVKAQKLPNGSKFAYGYDSAGNVTSITQSTDDGEGNSTEIRYNYGSPTRLTSGNNTVFYEYDIKRRITKVTVNGTETTYAYSGTGGVMSEALTVGGVIFESVKADMVTATFDGATVESYTDKHGNAVMTKINGHVTSVNAYDSNDNLTASADCSTGSVKKYKYSEDGLKQLTDVEISEGNGVEGLTEQYFYNVYGQVSGRVINGAVDQEYAYFYKDNAARDIEHVSLPNGLNSYPQTDVNGRSTGKELKNIDNDNIYGEYVYYRKAGDHGTFMPSSVYFGKNKNGRYSISDNIKYKYDEMGNITEIRENGLLTVRYTYDKIGRIVREDNRKFGKTTLWSYDNCGNILSQRETNYTLKPTDEITEFESEHLYTYDGDKLLSFGKEILFYTDKGKEHANPLIYRGQQLTWNYGRQLASFGGTEFTYDGYGRRIKKNNTVFTYDANNKLIKQSDGVNTLEFIYDNDGLSGVTYNGAKYIYSKDIQGNIVGILDSEGHEVVQYAYSAWGKVKTVILDEAHAAIVELNPYRYRSYYLDIETNLYYLQTRYYDPEVGRFISQDDVSYLDPEHINGLNLYAYCGNNPVMFTDPEGTTQWWEWLIAAVVVVVCVIGAIFTGGTSLMCAAALMGAAIAGGISLVSQGIEYAITGRDFSWGKFVLDLGVGALSGVIGASGISQVGSMLCGAGIGGVSDFASQLIKGTSIDKIDWLSVGISALAGGVAGWFSGAGAHNKVKMDMHIMSDSAVQSAQASVARVGDKLSNGLYATARGAKSAYTQAMNRMSKAIFAAAHSYSVSAIRSAMIGLAASTSTTAVIDIIRKIYG